MNYDIIDDLIYKRFYKDNKIVIRFNKVLDLIGKLDNITLY